MFQPQSEKNQLVLTFIKKLYEPYYVNILERNLNNIDIHTFFCQSSLKFYDKYIGEIFFKNESMNVFRGCLLLYNYFLNCNKMNTNDERYSPIVYLKLIYTVVQYEKQIGKTIYYCNREILQLMLFIVIKSINTFHNEEWMFFIKILISFVGNITTQESEDNYIKNSFEILFSILNTIFQKQLSLTSPILTNINSLIIILNKNKKYLSFSFFNLLFDYCARLINRKNYECLEAYIVLGFTFFSFEFNSEKEKCELVLCSLNKIVEQKQIDMHFFISVITKYYHYIFNKVCFDSINNNEFIQIIIKTIDNSGNNTNEIINTILHFDFEKEIEFEDEKALELMQKKKALFINIYRALLSNFNRLETKHILQYIIESSLSKRILDKYIRYNNKSYSWSTKSLVHILLDAIILTPEGKIIFCNNNDSNNKIISYKKDKSKEENSINYYIDIDSIVANYIYHIGF